MKEKENKWMKWAVSIAVLVVLIAGVLIGTLTKKDKGVDLVVTAEDITVEQGKSSPVEYKSSIKDAVVRFRIVNTTIAEVSGESVLGKAVGETELVIIARYESMVFEKRIAVKVTEKNDVSQETPKPSKPDSDDDDEEEKKEDPNSSAEEGSDSPYSFQLRGGWEDNQSGCGRICRVANFDR